MADEDIKYQLYTFRSRLQRIISTPFEPASILPKLSYRAQILDQDLTRTLDSYHARQTGKGGLIVGVLGGLSGNVRAEVEELGRIREEARRVARDIEEALRLSSSLVGGGRAAEQERKVAA